MSGDILEVLISRETIRKRVLEIAAEITSDHTGEDLVLVGVLKGGFVFMADLAREIGIPLEVDFISVSSYGDSAFSSGVVRIVKDIDTDITGRSVIIVEDIVDTGLTLQYLKELFYTRMPKSLKICTILDKPCRRTTEIDIEYRGIEIPDRFVVGYGLDYKGKYRNLPDICVIDS